MGVGTQPVRRALLPGIVRLMHTRRRHLANLEAARLATIIDEHVRWGI